MPRLRAALLALLALAAAPAAARADATLTFDDIAAETTLTTQQVDLPGEPGEERGIEWGLRPDWPDGTFRFNPRVVAPGDITPFSGAQVLRPALTGGCPPRRPTGAAAKAKRRGTRPRVVLPSLCTYHLTGRFPLAKERVSVRVGVENGRPAAYLVLRLLDVNGDLLGQDIQLAQPGSMNTLLSVQLAGRTAVYMTVESLAGDQGPFFYADDVSFDAPPDPPPADFGLKVGLSGTPQLDLIPGQQATVPITLTRVNRSAGAVALSIAGLPGGVTASFAPASLVGRNGVASVLTLRAAASAPDISLRNLTVTATPADASAGTVARSRTVRLSVETLKIYDAQITGMEISQATQYPGIPRPNPFDPGAAVPYTGVQLVGGRRTVVRVFANNARAVPLGGLAADVVLRGYGRNGKELAGSPLYPVSGPDSLLPNNGTLDVPEAVRTGNKAFVFVLPDVYNGGTGQGNWTVNAVRLRAEIIGPGDVPSFTRQTVFECSEPRCRANNAFTVTDISWARMPILEIWPIQVTGPQEGPPPSPWEVFEKVQAVTPMTVNVPYAYKVTISDEGLDYDGDRDDLQDEIISRMEDWADGFVLDGYLPVATGKRVTGVTSAGAIFDPTGHDQPSVIVRGTLRRPLSSVAHEIGHALGRPHAGQNCPGTRPGDDQEGEQWLPDDMGLLQGYGMDTAAVSFFTPPAIIASTAATPKYDFMTYCGVTEGDPDAWISPRGWDSIVSRYRTGAFPLRPRPASGPLTQTLHVSAIVGGAAPRIAFVRRGPARDLTGPASGYTARALDAADGLLAQTALVARESLDGGGDQTILRGDLPLVDGIAKVQLVGPGGPLATLARSATPPTVRITKPAAGTRVRSGRPLVVRWTASDADGDPLRATIDYSIDDGRTWKPLGLAPSTGSFTLGGRLLQGSTKARVRVRVRDTLDEVAAVSGRIRVDGAPPVARILSPRNGSALPADAMLVAQGTAFDDGGRTLGARRLRWYANGRLVGSGPSLALRGLAPGRVLLRLVGTDARGRSGAATVRVNVKAVVPRLTTFERPARLGRRARKVVLRVSASVTSTMTVLGQSFPVSTTPRRVVVRITPGGTPLVLKVRLAAGGKSSTGSITIPRR